MSPRLGVVASLLAAGAAAGLGGCAARPRASCGWPAAVGYAATADSLSLEAFARLTSAQRLARRQQAATWRDRAQRAGRAGERLRSLRTAAGLAPDDAATWLALGETSRWLGDRAAAARAAEAALAAAASLPRHARQAPSLRAATLRAWLERDRGEWSLGLAQVDSALALVPRDREATLLRGLLLGQRGEVTRALLVAREIERADPFLSDWAWIRGVAALGDGRPEEAFHWLHGRDPRQGGRAEDEARRPERPPAMGDPTLLTRYMAAPDVFHRADYWNDLGLLCERLGRLADARRFYERAARSCPERDPDCVRRRELPLREGDPVAPTLPVWLAFDRYPVAGSWWAYTLEVARRYEGAATPADRVFWGDAAVEAASIALRKGIEPLMARALRGRLYVQLQAFGLAEADLSRASDELAELGRAHAPTHYWYGYLKIRGDRCREALGPLRQAVAADPDLAPAWSALGYALVMTDDVVGARGALDRALALDPGRAEAWYNRGLMHFQAERWSDAVLDLQRAAELAPENVDVADLLDRAILQAQQSRRDAAARP